MARPNLVEVTPDNAVNFAQALQPPGGGGTSNGMDPVTRLEDKVDSNFRWTLGVYGAGFMILLAAFAAGFIILLGRLDTTTARIDSKLDSVVQKLGDVDAHVARIEERIRKLP